MKYGKTDYGNNIIKLTNQNGKYNIKIQQMKNKEIFDKKILVTESFSDLFLDLNLYKDINTDFDKYYDYYLEIQSLISKFLIIKNNKSDEIKKKQLSIEF